MHPPAFNRHQHRLSDWPDCCLELRCLSAQCRERMSLLPIRLARVQHGDPLFVELLSRLRCQHCKAPPAPVYLVAGHHRTHHGGPPADWSIELVEPPRPFVPLVPPNRPPNNP